jgi:hypothetical protein
MCGDSNMNTIEYQPNTFLYKTKSKGNLYVPEVLKNGKTVWMGHANYSKATVEAHASKVASTLSQRKSRANMPRSDDTEYYQSLTYMED